MIRKLKSLSLAAAFVMAGSGAALADKYCATGKPIRIADVTWQSGAFLTNVLIEILSKGYDCQIEKVSGDTLILSNALINGDLDIHPEQWIGRTEVLNKARDEGKVQVAGHPFVGAREGWFVPAYVIRGDGERGIAPMAPDLKSVDQLADPAIKALFSDPEEPSKGRFLNCPTGWSCEKVNSAKLEGYGLNAHYTNFLPGSGAALDAEIASAQMRKQPILFYYWNPTAVMGAYDLIQLEEPAYSEECWTELKRTNSPKTKACGFPEVEVGYDVNSKFAEKAPDILEILSKATIPLEIINAMLAQLAATKGEPASAAADFLKNHQQIWTAWVSAEAAEKIKASLN